MPLPNLKNQCRAKCKATKQRCRNPCAYEMHVCAKHGAHRKVVKGEAHWNYQGKQRSRQDKAIVREEMQELKQLAHWAKKCGLID